MGSGGGAAARRRMRIHMKRGSGSSTTTTGSTIIQRTDSDSFSQTPPHSPQSVKHRYHHHHQQQQSTDSVGSKGGKSTDRVSNYSVMHQHHHHHRQHVMSANRSVGSTRSVTSSASSSDMNLFDAKHPHAGFTFDAFGLDASLINQEVSEAMNDIAGTNPDLSFFLDQDPTDDFAAGRWDSPPGSRSATPIVENEDGFVDGFRVHPPAKQSALPVHLRQQSPTTTTVSTDKSSSLTSESSDRPLDGRINLFKEQAGFHATHKPRKVVRPPDHDHQPSSTTRANSSSSFKARISKLPSASIASSHHRSRDTVRLPQLDGGGPSPPPTARPQRNAGEPMPTDPEFEADFSDFSGSSSSRNGDRPQAPSDVGVSDNFAPSGAAATTPAVDIVAELKAKKEERSLASVDDASRFRTTQDEKKEEDHSDVAAGGGSSGAPDRPQPSPRVGNLKAQWERREAARKAELLAAAPSISPASAATKGWRSPSKAAAASLAPRQHDEEELRQRPPSFSNRRDGLRPVTSHSARSEAGAAPLRSSHIGLVLDGLEQRKLQHHQPREARSDVGVPSPSFAQRNRWQPPVASPTHEFAANFSQVDDATSQEPFRIDTDQRIQSPDRTVQPGSPSAKMNYRERRELELKQRREEEERLQTSKSTEESAERDVATLIKRRIAATKKTAQSESNSNQLHHDPEDPIQAMKPYDESPREFGRREKSSAFFESDVASSSDVTAAERQVATRPSVKVAPPPREGAAEQSPPRLAASRPPELNLEQPSQPKHDAAVSHLLMLQQIQQKQRRGALSVLSTGQSDVSEPLSLEEKSQKATTPKATMMMLNAFLAGRETLVSKDLVGGRSTHSSHDRTQDEARGSSSPRDQPDEPPNSGYSLPARKDDPKYERYYKMLKVGMPMDVVKHAAMRDGQDPSVLDGDPNKPVGVPLRHEPEFAKYFKMLSFGLPMEAVKHAMARDGLDSSVMDQDHDLPLQSRKKDEGDDDEPKEKDSHRRARLHWKPLRSVTSNSLWANLDQDGELEKLKFNEKEFQELFQVEKATEAAQKAAATSGEPKRGAVRVIDPKRANNGGIILARLKMSHDEMADAVDGINERALSAEQIENIIEYLPTREERKALETYMLEGGQDAAEKFEGLCECEKFMVSMMTVKHAKRKVRALLFKLQFQTCLEDIHRDTVAVEAACDELCNSVRLRKLLGIVLTFGNRLNTAGNGKHRAGAFTLDSLLKLNQAKAFDKKTTFLHYIVLIVQRNNELLLRFKDDIPTVFKADKVYWDQCVNDLEEVENQLENVRKIALYQARQATAYRLRRKKRDEDEESLSEGEASLTLEEEVEALRATPIGMFTLSAIKYVSSLRDRVEDTKAKYSRLLEYFGEESNMQPHELFNTIVSFSRDFDKAKEQVFANEVRKQREERKRQAVVSNGMNQHGRPPTHSPAQTEKKQSEKSVRASNLQPNMSHVLKEMKTRISNDATEGVPLQEEHPAMQGYPVIDVRDHGVSQDLPLSSEQQPTSYEQAPLEHESVPPLRPAENRPPERRSQASILAEREVARRLSTANSQSVRSENPNNEASISAHANPEAPNDLSAPITPSKSPPTLPSASTSVRAKARLRRHRYVIERSPSSPATTLVPQTPEAAPRPIPASAPSSSVRTFSTPPQQHQQQPPQPRMYGRPATSIDDGAQPVMPLSPRSSMRNRMERHKLRHSTTASGSTSNAGDSPW